MISVLHAPRADQQIGVQPGDALRDHKVALSLPDQLMGDRDDVARDGKAAERDMGAIGNAPDHLGRGSDFASHEKSLTLAAHVLAAALGIAIRSKERHQARCGKGGSLRRNCRQCGTYGLRSC
jgi:hypothetical protein